MPPDFSQGNVVVLAAVFATIMRGVGYPQGDAPSSPGGAAPTIHAPSLVLLSHLKGRDMLQ
jgi:hypothetical protein